MIILMAGVRRGKWRLRRGADPVADLSIEPGSVAEA